ncbi:MAG: metallophosphoesterase [Acidimicrobiia bacterium]|nr:metallophosphoesterase [Acidimicrobiia bacterium]
MDLVRNAELMSVGVDEVVVTFTTGTDVEITTRVGDHDVTTTGPFHVARVTGLEPATVYPLSVETEPVTDFLPDRVRTLDRPAGRLLATVATANDVHFGETECGKLGHEVELGPVLGSRPGEPPYPEVMNRAAVDEIAALDPDAVVVKGDLTNVGSEEEYGRFLEVWSELGERMHHVRGNHDAMISERIAAHAPFAVVLPGVVLAVLDTVTPGTDRGRVTADELAWLDALAAGSTDPVLVFGHHHPWDPDSNTRPEHYFGIHPDDSVALCEVVAPRGDRRVLRGPHPPQPHPALRRGPVGAHGRGRLREGLPGRVGRVPRLRRWLHAGDAAHRGRRRDGLDRADPGDVRRAVPGLRPRLSRRPLLQPAVLRDSPFSPESARFRGSGPRFRANPEGGGGIPEEVEVSGRRWRRQPGGRRPGSPAG